jgi:fatty-acyl-CoA synthase
VSTEFNLATVHETIAEVIPDQECVVQGDLRLTYADLADRSRRLASVLHDAGLGCRTERSELAPHESGQDHVGLYLYNGNEYLEGMLGAYKARVVPFNVNYRYVDEELRYLFHDAATKGVIYHSSFAPALARVLPELPGVELLLQVDDGSGEALLPGARWYEQALAEASAEPLSTKGVAPSPDDLYVVYTGGTTGMPKGVLWRQHDIFMAAMGGRAVGTWEELSTYEEIAEKAKAGAEAGGFRLMPLPPLMHGAAQWASFIIMTGGGTIVMPEHTRSLDAREVLETAEREKVGSIAFVGDAMARPVLEELDRKTYDLSNLIVFGNGGAPLNPTIKEQLLEHVPHAMVGDSAGSSETGAQMTNVSTKGDASTGKFTPGPQATVLDESMSRVLEPGSEETGWLAQTAQVPLGYLGDPDKTARTFPTVDGVRYAVPGDRAKRMADGAIELLGRDSVTINSGGEKIFAEEVEGAIAQHDAVQDVIVVGRPSERWGQEVVAVVQLKDGASATEDELTAAAGERVARYKLPKGWVFVDQTVRSPAGKADYRWAKEQAEAATA